MRLTAYADYSLRVLIYLALQPTRRATIEEISNAYRLSANHLMKIIWNLRQLGYIETTRGRGGGLRLAGKPEEINIGRLVRQVEPDFALTDCFTAQRRLHCRIEPACRLRRVFEKAVQSFLSVLDNYSLADLVRNGARLKPLLNIRAIERGRL